MKIRNIIFILITSLFLTGCWNYNELNKYSIVTGMAIDYKDSEYEVSMLISNTSQAEDADSKVVILSGKGKSIFQAIKDVGLISPKELYISHLSIVVVSEDVAKNGLDDLLDFLLREPQAKDNFYLTIAKDCKAKDTLAILNPLESFPSQGIADNISLTSHLQGSVAVVDFTTISKNYINKGKELSLNGLVTIGDIEDGTKVEEQQNSILKAYVKLSPLAIFKDAKLIDWASHDESVGINYINNMIKESYLNVKCDKDFTIINIIGNKTKIEVDKDKITVNINTEATISENTCDIDLKDPSVIKELEDKSNKIIKDYCDEAIQLAQRLKSDIFGFGNKIYKDFPKYYNSIENWNDHFASLDIKVNVKTSITSKGTINTTIEGEK